MELPHGLVEDILEKLPVKSLLRFKSVSTQWKSTIESPYFKKKQLLWRQLEDPDILLLNPREYEDFHSPNEEENVTRMFTVGSLDLIKLPNLCPLREPILLEFNQFLLYYTYSISWSCDGMICYYNHYNRIYVVNPITRWSRSVPPARFQAVALDIMNLKISCKGGDIVSWHLGFGKDKFTGTYKLVWLYNSFEFGLNNATICEVFDFSTNTWRYVTGAPVRVYDKQNPVHLDGSLHWFTDECITETRVLSFDIHTETFHIISKTPFVHAVFKQIIMCTLNNRLCVSQKEWPKQEIWSLNDSDITWEKTYSLDLQTDPHWFTEYLPLPPDQLWLDVIPCVIPVAVLKEKKSLVLYYGRAKNPNLVIYDPKSRSYDLCFVRDYNAYFRGKAVSFFPSLMSIE